MEVLFDGSIQKSIRLTEEEVKIAVIEYAERNFCDRNGTDYEVDIRGGKLDSVIVQYTDKDYSPNN